jgi:hypothetical protein
MNVLHIGRNITHVFHSPQEIKAYVFSEEFEKDLEKTKVFNNVVAQKPQVKVKPAIKEVVKEPVDVIPIEVSLPTNLIKPKLTKLF